VGLVADLFKRAEARQALFFDKLSNGAKEKLDEVEIKFAELRVTGPEGGVFYFRFKAQRLVMLDGTPDVPWEELDKFLLDGDDFNYPGGDEVLFDVIDRELSPRAAVSRRYFTVNTDKIVYDTEEFAQAFERFLDDLQVILGGKRGAKPGSRGGRAW